MKHVAVIGGGIAGISAAYELAQQQWAGAPVSFTLLEASNRLGGIVETVLQDNFVIECGPDSWVTEKPWARELAVELGVEHEIIFSEDEHRRTYLAEGGELHPMPQGMRMMVPVEWEEVLSSSLFSDEAKKNYLCEPDMAEQLKRTALDAASAGRDESVREFVVRHFGAEVANTIAAPLLAGVFGGDIAVLSARAVLPTYVALEREYGSLILGLQQARKQGSNSQPIFSSLKNGLAGLIDGMASRIPADSIRYNCTLQSFERIDDRWRVHVTPEGAGKYEAFDAVLIATPAKTTAQLLAPLNPNIAELFPSNSSSAIVVAFAFSPEQTGSLQIPEGFGFLVPQRGPVSGDDSGDATLEAIAQRALLACTFVDQKFSHRVPPGGVLLRAFFGGAVAPVLLQEDDATLIRLAHSALENILGQLPDPAITVVRRWPNSLPLYEVGHLERIAQLEAHIATLPNIQLIGNAYHGVGLPDLIREGRSAARKVLATLS